MDEQNDLAQLSELDLVLRMNLLWTIIGEYLGDPRCHNPLNQLDTLLHELMARYPQPTHQVVGLSTLNMRGEAHTK